MRTREHLPNVETKTDVRVLDCHLITVPLEMDPEWRIEAASWETLHSEYLLQALLVLNC